MCVWLEGECVHLRVCVCLEGVCVIVSVYGWRGGVCVAGGACVCSLTGSVAGEHVCV